MHTQITLTEDEERLIRLFKALSNPIRYKLVRYMVEHPQCITGELAEFAHLAQSTVSQHLKVLREAEIVCGEVEGTATAYCLNPAVLAWFKEQVMQVADQLTECC